MLKLLPFLIYFLMLFSCTVRYEEQANTFFSGQKGEHSDFDICYTLKSKDSVKGLFIKGQLLASSDDGKMMAGLFLAYNEEKSITSEDIEITLQTPEGNFSDPLNDSAITSGNIQKLRLQFQPTHNRKLFMKTGLKGDLNKSYTLSLKLRSITAALHFELADTVWENYRQHHALEPHIRFFKPRLDKQVQQAYQEQLGKSDFVYVDENELALAGVNLQLHAYLWRDTLHLKFKIVNHSDNELQVLPEKLQVTANAALSLTTALSGNHTLRKSQRFIENYSFYCPVPVDSFRISKKFIEFSFTSGQTYLLKKDLGFLSAPL
ncbi:hypothetical protein FNH22_10220 [Fulvivirga sp. M361]|uniref:hypothetical protein n=1 Tax=Fulvivirga sp. M361 TaxID=2594266 RepID=UPI00117AD178|nr:hypothetical protein [Fulvivirga sp. M361]TRX59522.1 hypothetical protein FNH22_10220 [Fulvivirga sp. M361]